eukprot:GHVR01132336.1.p1 GENE.GHVR01132336.1~~GHVR01132336.1.p1  ORF type:complete len:196 (+),score=64.60 GHVR01132336.1:314-901(+)
MSANGCDDVLVKIVPSLHPCEDIRRLTLDLWKHHTQPHPNLINPRIILTKSISNEFSDVGVAVAFDVSVKSLTPALSCTGVVADWVRAVSTNPFSEYSRTIYRGILKGVHHLSGLGVRHLSISPYTVFLDDSGTVRLGDYLRRVELHCDQVVVTCAHPPSLSPSLQLASEIERVQEILSTHTHTHTHTHREVVYQ